MIKNGLVEGVKLDRSSDIWSCDSCEYAKAHKKPIQKEQKEPWTSDFGKEVHLNVWGPSPVQNMNSREYYSFYTDHYSWYTHLYLLHIKNQNFDAYKYYKTKLWTQYGADIKRLHSDWGGEYLSTAFDEHFAKLETLWSLTVHGTPKYNGVSEWLNHMLLEKV